MSEPSSRLPARSSLEQLHKQAKDLVRQKRYAKLAEAQFALAREYGFETWAALKRYLEAGPYLRIAEDVVLACRNSDAGAAERLGLLFGGHPSIERIRNQVWLRLNTEPGRVFDPDGLTIDDGRLFVARLYGFGSWAEFAASLAKPAGGVFYQVHWKDRSIEARAPLSEMAWDEIFDAMRRHRITRLRSGQMTDRVLEKLSRLDLVTSLQLEGSRQVTDEGLKHLARMTSLERLNLTGCGITDRGLGVLRELPELKAFYLYHHGGVSDKGLANLVACDKLEQVDLLGSNAGDGVIRALRGKVKLRHFKSGNHVTDAGLPLLHEFPVFKTWQGGEPEFSLMTYQPEPNLLLLRGEITDAGMASLEGLDGLYALNLDDARCSVSAEGIGKLAALPRLAWLAFDAKDDTMGAIAALPRLRNLMCQDTGASDSGFIALSRSRTIEYIWGRRCYGLTGSGFRAMGRMPALRGLSVSCKNVDDAALATLPDFPALVEFMPMDVPDEGFRHVGRCERLEKMVCMYCRDTGDVATGHLVGLKRLISYYAGYSRITDRSLGLLGGMESLEEVSLEGCAGVTNAGIAQLGRLPRLRELSVGLMPGVTREAIGAFPDRVRVSFES